MVGNNSFCYVGIPRSLFRSPDATEPTLLPTFTADAHGSDPVRLLATFLDAFTEHCQVRHRQLSVYLRSLFRHLPEDDIASFS